jgi:DNA-binding transcriptional LysR family regulator
MNMALLGADHPLATRAELTLKDLSEIPFIFMSRSFSPGLHDVVMGTFDRAGFAPRIDGEYDGLSTVWALVAQGLGWALGSQSQRAAPPQGIVAVPITDFDMPWGLELVFRRDESRMPVLEMVQALRRAAKDLEAGMAAPTNKYWSSTVAIA